LLSAVAPRRLANLQGEEARLLALLSATFGKAVSPSVLGNIERAAKSWLVGDDTAAVIHLAHAGLPRPDDPDEAARRLFVTDAFIKAGTSPIGILQALGLDAGYVGTVAKLYNEFEPARSSFPPTIPFTMRATSKACPVATIPGIVTRPKFTSII
jgi:hypothetical protein